MSAKWPIEYLIKVLENIIFWGEDFSMSCHHHKVIIQITKEIEITVEVINCTIWKLGWPWKLGWYPYFCQLITCSGITLTFLLSLAPWINI